MSSDKNDNFNPNTSIDEMTDEIPLEETSATPTATADIVTDENNKNDNDENDDVNALLDELKQQPSEEEIAVENLKKSTSRLKDAIFNVSSDIDAKLGIVQTAKHVDENLGIRRTASSTASAVGSLWNKLHLKEKAMDVVNSDAVRNISHSLSDTLEHTGVKTAVADGSQRIKRLDEEHKITSFTAKTIAGGVDWVTMGLNTVTGKSSSDNNNESGSRDDDF